MRINTDIFSLQAQRQLSTTSKAISRALEHLASGKRINSARDGAAEIAIGNGLESQRRGLLQTIRNINDTKGYIETLSGVISTQSEILQRMTELAIQSANGILSSDQRSYLSQEFQQLVSEFSRLASQTEFNGEKIADGSFITKKIQVGTQKGQTIDLSLPSLLARDIFVEERGSGNFTSTYFRGGAQTGAWTNTRDINGDGLDDIVASNLGSSAYIQLALGNGSFTSSRTLVTISGTTIRWSRLEDVNEDGKLDFLASADGGFFVLALGNGNGTFQTAQTIAAAGGNQTRQLNVGDFNGDGFKDVIIADYLAASTLSIFLGNGNGTFQARTTISQFAYAVEVGDLNEDGRDDFVVNNQGTVTSIYLGNGNGTFAISQTFGTAASSIVLGDVNNDGHLDSIFGDTGTQVVSVALGNGNGTFQTVTTYYSPDGWTRAVSLADINGDGNLDLGWSSDSAAVASIMIGKGDGTFTNLKTFVGELSTNFFFTDTDDDGITDIVIPGFNFYRTYLGIAQTVSATDKLSIATQDDAIDVLDVLQNARDQLNAASANIGAIRSRLDYAENSSLSTVESVSQARSNLIDADYAQEITELAGLQILQEAGVSVLSQANLNLKLVLSLLKS